MANKIIPCKVCGKEIASKAKSCPHCGAKNGKPVFTKWWFWALVVVVLIGVIGGAAGSSEGGTSAPKETTVNTEPTEVTTTVNSDAKMNVFSGDCGISATAEMGTDIIGQPTLTVSITNTTNKTISAIKFYAVPLDVYGDEVTGIYAQHNLYTDDSIAAGASDSVSWQFIDNQVKTVQLYVYSVYFSDGTEWGDKDATKSVILKNGLQIEVEGTSER